MTISSTNLASETKEEKPKERRTIELKFWKESAALYAHLRSGISSAQDLLDDLVEAQYELLAIAEVEGNEVEVERLKIELELYGDVRTSLELGALVVGSPASKVYYGFGDRLSRESLTEPCETGSVLAPDQSVPE